MLPTLFWTKAAATEDENHWIVLLKLRRVPAFCGVVCKSIIREDSAWNNIESHLQGFSLCDCVSSEIAFQFLPESGHGSASGAIAQCRAQCEQQRKIDYRRREQSACGRPRRSQHEFQSKVQEPQTQQCTGAVKNGSVPCRKLHH